MSPPLTPILVRKILLMFKTRLTELLGIEYPIICGGMFRLGRAELAAAVSNAGGLGIITAASFPDAASFRTELQTLKGLTTKPFGVNINLFPTARAFAAQGYIDICVEEGVPVVETSGRSPEPYMSRLKDASIKVIHKVPGASYVRTAERVGCDAVSVVGNETGGHPGMSEVGTLVMLRRAMENVRIPIVAGGGFVDGAGLLAALSLGADGIIMGTRFLATRECPAHPAVKDWMVNASEDDTVIIQRSIKSPMRVARNGMALKVLIREQERVGLEELLPLITGTRNPLVYSEGRLDDAIWSCGQAVGLVKDVPTCQELIDRIIGEARVALERVNRLSVGAAQVESV
jgi:NAD(P)H-dependent flavin oxidoreductase YrpB (nitropropane dioxygenase family)